MAGTPRDLRFIGEPAGLAERLKRELAAHGFGGDAGLQQALAADAAHLARLFCDVMHLAAFELRLEVVRSDSCRKFHADYVSARLITTYVGEGTDWLADDEARALAEGREPQRIHRLAAFDVGLFKGKLATDCPAIHRSPPIAETPGGARLLLVLDPERRLPVAAADSPLSQPSQLA